MSCIKGPHKKMLKTVLLQGWHSAFKGPNKKNYCIHYAKNSLITGLAQCIKEPNKKRNYCIHYAQNSFTRGLQEAFRLPAHRSQLEQPAQEHGHNSHPPVLTVQMAEPSPPPPTPQ